MKVDKYVGPPQNYSFALTPQTVKIFCYRWHFLRLNESYKRDFKRVNTDKNLGKKVFALLVSNDDLNEIKKKYGIGYPVNPRINADEIIDLLKYDDRIKQNPSSLRYKNVVRANMAVFGLLESDNKCGFLNPIIQHPVLWHGLRGTEITFEKKNGAIKFIDGFQEIESIEDYKNRLSEINIAIDINCSLDQILKKVKEVIVDWRSIYSKYYPVVKSTRNHWDKYDEYIKVYRCHKFQKMSHKAIAKKIYGRADYSAEDKVRKDINAADYLINGGYRKIT